MARMVILNKDLIRSKRCKKKHKGHCTWMHSGRVWNTIYEFMEYSGYSFLTVYELKKKGILTIKDRKEKKTKFLWQEGCILYKVGLLHILIYNRT